jgi:DNA-binding winged helix-turn-helix (wHTH) protein
MHHADGGAPLAGGDEAYAFGPFVLDLQNRALYRNGLPVELPSKIFEILQCFVLRTGRVVSKDALVEHVWQGAPVGDNNIAQHMHLARTLLGDATRPHQYIATVHGRGYRLLVEPRKVETPRSQGSTTQPQVSKMFAVELVSNAGFFARMGTPSALDSSMQLCRKALQLAGPSAEAHAQIATSAILKAAFLYAAPVDQFEIARRHAEEALKLDAYCARAHAAMAMVSVLGDLSPQVAFSHLDVAAAARPDMPEIAIVRAIALTASKRHDAGRETAMQALSAHPGSIALAVYAAFCAYHGGDLEWAAQSLERLLVFKPTAAFATFLLSRVHLAQGNYSSARAALMSIISGRASAMAGYEKFRQRAIGSLSFVEARAGALEDARALAKDVQRSEHCSYVALAVARAGSGEEESVIACLQEARRRRDPWFPFVGSDPVFREYRDLPEFQAVVSGENPSLKIS